LANKTKELNEELGAYIHLSFVVPKALAPSSFLEAEHLRFGWQRHRGLQTTDPIVKISPVKNN